MRRNYCLLPRRQRVEVLLSLLLVIAIAAVLLFPTGRTANREKPHTVFTLMENDYVSPLLSSAAAIRKLNGLTKQLAQFAGYDDVRVRTELPGAVSIVNVTRFSGDLLAMLNVGFLMRSNYTGEQVVYISEKFWATAYARSSNILNMTIRLHETIYRIAGVTSDSPGLLASTEVWMPIRSRGTLGKLNSMRIVGALCRECDWKAAQDELAKVFDQFMTDQIYAEAKGLKMLPITNGIEFAEGMITVTPGERSKSNVHLAADYQPAALPSRRGS